MWKPTIVFVRPPGATSAAGGLKVLDKALRVLGLFTERRPEWTVTDISRELALPLTTAHRIVRALEAHHLLRRTSDSRYRLGLAAISLGRRAVASFDLRAVLRPSLEWLSAETDETTSITTFDEGPIGSLCIDVIERVHPLRVSVEIGSVTPLHAGAHARALLASLGEDVLALVLSRPLEQLASGTITDPGRLRAELEAVRERGWAFARDEAHEGAWSMAAPVFDASETALASIGFASPTARYAPELEERGAQYVVEAARQASATLSTVS
jgi:DNA-binding IclR family transcriptional regulator